MGQSVSIAYLSRLRVELKKLLAIDFEACVFLNADKDYGTTDNRISWWILNAIDPRANVTLRKVSHANNGCSVLAGQYSSGICYRFFCSTQLTLFTRDPSHSNSDWFVGEGRTVSFSSCQMRDISNDFKAWIRVPIRSWC